MSAFGLRVVMLLTAVLLLSACSAGEPTVGTDSSPREIDLTMTDEMTFAPATIEVRRGETVLFRIRNSSNEAHEAYIGSEEEQTLHATRHSAVASEEQTAIPHINQPAVHVPPLGTGEFLYRFDERVELVIGCHYPGHYEAGMRAVIEVSE
jgi:uncharacterized cupredoxin-like copper-binding protein